MIRRFWGALQFLTVLPVSVQTAAPGKAAVFFPLVGAFLGILAGVLFLLTQRLFGSAIAGLIAMAALVMLTVALHEDGLADVADAFRAERSREKIMSILKDSRIGVYGALALVISFTLRWQALLQSQRNAILALAVSLAVSRAALVSLAFFTPPIGEGLGASFKSSLSVRIVMAVLTQAVLFALLCGWRGVFLLLASGLTVALARSYFLRRLGGINGDCLGAACQAVETVSLMVLAWRPSS